MNKDINVLTVELAGQSLMSDVPFNMPFDTSFDATHDIHLDGLSQRLTAEVSQRWAASVELTTGSVSVAADWYGRWLSRSKAAFIHADKPLHRSVRALQFLLDKDLHLAELVDNMLRQGSALQRSEMEVEHEVVETKDEWLLCLHHAVTSAPQFELERGFGLDPLYGVLVFMLATDAADEFFSHEAVNRCFLQMMNTWYAFLSSPASLSALNTGPNGWLCHESWVRNRLDQYVTSRMLTDDPVHWGFSTYLSFQNRRVIQICRPLDGSEVNSVVVVSPCDGRLSEVRHSVDRKTRVMLRDQSALLSTLVPDDAEFHSEGAEFFRINLGVFDLHRWFAPVSGTIVSVEKIPANRCVAPLSQIMALDPAKSSVNTMVRILIETKHAAGNKKVLLLALGSASSSSVCSYAKAGQCIEKGDEIGWFNDAGGVICLIFEADLIERFIHSSPPQQLSVCQQTHLRAKAQIAVVDI
ncbi:Phosphatidylserine decarboxylase proenzyme [BD1-7 clade bacterium]|uniref:Phosphatidylserine decarboxylase proenzyme n=1 Tax=BD1-7 clade bacterium TaxID=2029982 RepID=A0A5S9QYM6_9GAMM|nr:Phosphatidylserine decarboxylase proenzyme [BD1-7 clade bacterium]